jgi:hypothetical protein
LAEKAFRVGAFQKVAVRTPFDVLFLANNVR